MSKKEILQKEAERLVSVISSKYKPEKVIIFGSLVSGKVNSSSDIDLFIVKNTIKSRRERNREVSRLLLDRQAPVDILVYTPSELKKRIELGDSFVTDIINSGLVVYAKK